MSTGCACPGRPQVISGPRLIGLSTLTALLAWAAWEARWQPAPEPPPPPAGEHATTAPLEPLQFAPLSDYPVTLERPLFYADRHLPNAATPADEDEPAAAMLDTAAATPRLALSAIIVEDGLRSALLAMPGQPTSTRVREGESLGGWRLVEIGDDAVTVEADGRREQIPLHDYGTAPPLPPRRAAPPRRPPRSSGVDPSTPPE